MPDCGLWGKQQQEIFEGHTCKTSRLNWTYNVPARKNNFIPEKSFLHTSEWKLGIALFWILSNVYDCSCERISPHRGNVIFTRMTRRWLVGQVAKVIMWLKGTWLATTEGHGSYKEAMTLKEVLFVNSYTLNYKRLEPQHFYSWMYFQIHLNWVLQNNLLWEFILQQTKHQT